VIKILRMVPLQSPQRMPRPTTRIFQLTLENFPVGKLFEKAGVKTRYNIETEQ